MYPTCDNMTASLSSRLCESGPGVEFACVPQKNRRQTSLGEKNELNFFSNVVSYPRLVFTFNARGEIIIIPFSIWVNTKNMLYYVHMRTYVSCT